MTHFLRTAAPALLASTLALAPAVAQDPDASASVGEASGALKDIRIVIKTDAGDIEATIFASKVPLTAANFLNLAHRDYYDNLTFHRVISRANGDRDDFMVQGGDPSGTGRGGPGYKFKDEIDPALKHNKPGRFSMANAGPNTNGSQFFITIVATPHLDGRHAVFGEVTKGQEIVSGMKRGAKILDVEILDPVESLFEAQAAQIKEWNAILDRRYPKPKP